MKIKIFVISFIIFILFLSYLTYFFLSPSRSLEQSPKTPSYLSEEVNLFENTFFDFLNQEFSDLLEKNSPDATSKAEVKQEEIEGLVNEAIQLIDRFKDQQQNLSSLDLDQLNRLKFYTYTTVAQDESKSRTMLDQLPPGENKLALLKTYIKIFSPLVAEEEMIVFLKQQKWADDYEADFQDTINQKLFLANPIGKKFPDHFKDFLDLKQTKHQLKDYLGKYVLIDFWATWCTPCLAEIPYLIDAYNRFGVNGKKVKNKFEIISISLDQDMTKLKEFLEERSIKWIQYADARSYDSPLVRRYKVNRIPTLYLLDFEGKVIEKDLSGRRLLKILNQKISL